MSSSSNKPLVFISYAHLDEPNPPEEPRWLSFVMDFLRPGEKGRRYTVWIDRLMPGGADWNPEIEAKVRACDIFVLLVSTHSTGSDYILDKEVPIVRERQRNGETVHLYPLQLDWTPDVGLDQVRDKNLRPRDGNPFSSLSPSERSRAMTEAANEIAGFAKAIEETKTATGAMSELLVLPFGAATSEPNDLIVSGVKIERVAPQVEAARAVPVVDITGLPETGYERLVGREGELALLDDAWNDGKTNIISLIAEGGAGKSALVNEWLMRLRRLSRRDMRARLVVLQPGLQRAGDCGGRISQLGASQTRCEDRDDQRLRQGRGDRRGVNGAPHSACSRWRRAVAAWARSANGPAQGPRAARFVAPICRRPAASAAQPDRSDQPRRRR
jgi:hypothetical protein